MILSQIILQLNDIKLLLNFIALKNNNVQYNNHKSHPYRKYGKCIRINLNRIIQIFNYKW